MMLAGYRIEDEALVPERLRIKIPITLALVLAAFATIDRLYPATTHSGLNAGVKAALCLGLGLALRPGEYLHQSTSRPGTHEALARKATFSFEGPGVDPNKNFSVCRPEMYPRLPSGQLYAPHRLVLFLDSTKNDTVGHGGPRALYSAPVDAQFSLLNTVFDCLRAFPPPIHGHLFDGIQQPPLTVQVVRDVLKVVAREHGLDPARVVPHGLRVGAMLQTDGASVTDQLALGNWKDLSGMAPYNRTALALGMRLAPFLHDPGVTTLNDLVFLCMPEEAEAAPLPDV
jgi:hypothetical protein